MKKIVVLSCLCLLMTGRLGAFQGSFLQFGKNLLANGDYQGALSQFESFVKFNPENGEGYYWIGYTLFISKKYQLALDPLKKALEKAPKFSPVYSALGRLYFENKQYETALPYLEKSVALRDTNPQTYNCLGMTYFYLGRFELAVKNISIAIKMDTTLAEAYCNRGACRYLSQDIAVASKIDKEMAEKDFNKAIQFDPNSEISYRNRAFVRLYLGKLPEAEADVQKAMQLDPDDPGVYYCHALILHQQKQYEDALKEFDRSIDMNPARADYFLDRGICKIDMGDGNGARIDFNKAMQLDKDKQPLAFLYIAQSYAAEKDKVNMLAYLQSAYKAGLFKNRNYITILQNDPYCKYYAKDKEYINMLSKIKFN